MYKRQLLASGVLMEGWSVEDDGAGVCFCVYAYNVQPGVELDYATGDSWLSGDEPQSGAQSTQDDQQETYVLNTSSGKFHLPSCSSVEKMCIRERVFEKSEVKVWECRNCGHIVVGTAAVSYTHLIPR